MTDEAETRNIKYGWLEVMVEPLNPIDDPRLVSFNIANIVTVRDTDQDTCQIHARDGVDYKVLESHASVMGMIANARSAPTATPAEVEEEEAREHN